MASVRLCEVAKLIRSKNAGPFHLTFDVMFEDEHTYNAVKNSAALTPQKISSLFGVSESVVGVFHYAPAYAIKFTIPRPTVSGDLADGDVFGGQQYGPLVEIKVEI